MDGSALQHDIDLGRVMQDIKRAARALGPKKLNDALSASLPAAAQAQPVPPAVPIDPETFYFMANRRFRMADFLGVEQRKFVTVAYAAILRREPDAGGLNHYNTPALASRFHRIEVICSMRRSDEGRARNVQIRNLVFWSLLLSVMRPVQYRRLFVRIFR
jgi:hypothetical protein